jgi:hypothetical protein
MAHSIRWFPSRCWVSLIFQFVNCYVPNIQAIFVDSSRLSSRTISGLAFTNFCLRCRWPSNGGKQMWPFKPRHLMRNLQHDFTYVFLLESVWGFVKKNDVTLHIHLHILHLHTPHFHILHLHILHLKILHLYILLCTICTAYISTSYICTSYISHFCLLFLSLSLCFSLSRFLSCADWCQAPKRWSKRCRCSCTCIFTVKCAELGQAPKSYKHIHIYIYVCVCLHRSSSHLQSSHLASAHLASSQLTAHIFSCYILHLPSFWWSLLTDLHSVSTIYVF